MEEVGTAYERKAYAARRTVDGNGPLEASCPPSMTTIERETERLHGYIDELSQALANLADRMHPVLSPTGEQAAKEEGRPTPTMSAVAMVINEASLKIAKLTTRVIALRERMEC